MISCSFGFCTLVSSFGWVCVGFVYLWFGFALLLDRLGCLVFMCGVSVVIVLVLYCLIYVG